MEPLIGVSNAGLHPFQDEIISKLKVDWSLKDAPERYALALKRFRMYLEAEKGLRPSTIESYVSIIKRGFRSTF